MPDEDKQSEGHVASILGGLTKFLGYQPHTPNRESPNALAEPTETESPVNVLNKEALRRRPQSSTLSPKSKTKKTVLRESSGTKKNGTPFATTPSKLAGHSHIKTSLIAGNDASTAIKGSPRGKKRSREAEDDHVVASKSPRTGRGANLVQVRNTGTANQSFKRANDNVAHEPKRGRYGEAASLGDAQSYAIQRMSEAGDYSSDGPGKRSQYPIVRIPTKSGRQLRRPAPLYDAAKSRTKERGEENYDFNSDPSPEKHRTLPPVAGTSQKGQSKAKRGAREIITRSRIRATEGRVVGSGKPTNMKPKRGSFKPIAKVTTYQERELESPPQEGKRQNQRCFQSTDGGSRISRRPHVPRNGVPEFVRAPAGFDGNQEIVDIEAGEDDTSESYIDGQNTERAPAKLTQWLVDELTRNDEPDPVYLGAHDAWNRIVEAARENCVDEVEELAKGNVHGLAEHSSKTVQDLSKIIQSASRLYRVLTKGKSDEEAQHEINEELSAIIDEIESKIKQIREFDGPIDGEKVTRSEGRETITDIYKRGVPDMIHLLNTAIICRGCVPLEIYDFKGIQEIVNLQKMTLHLCNTAVKWKAKPFSADKPFIRNVRSIIFPALRDKILFVFTKEMQRLFLIERKKANRGRTQDQNAKRQREEEELEVERRADGLRRIEEDIRRNQEKLRAIKFGLHSPVDSRRSLQPKNSSHQVQYHDTLWTLDEERELIKQLQKKRSRDLPATERYLQILNASPLQNKLPEHIQKKALELKPFLMEVLPDVDYICSIV